MSFPDWLKIQAVRYYKNLSSAAATAEQIKLEFQLDISPRTITHWAKNNVIANAAENEGSLFIEQNNLIVNQIQPIGQKFDVKDFVKKHREFFEKSSKKLNELLEILYNSIQQKDLLELSTKEKLAAISKLEKIIINKNNFLLNIIARSGDDEDSLAELMSELTKELGGNIEETLSDKIEEKINNE